MATLEIALRKFTIYVAHNSNVYDDLVIVIVPYRERVVTDEFIIQERKIIKTRGPVEA